MYIYNIYYIYNMFMYIYMYCRCYIYIYIYINIPPLACPGTFCVIMCNRYYVHITWIHAAVVKTINYTCSVYIYIYIYVIPIFMYSFIYILYTNMHVALNSYLGEPRQPSQRLKPAVLNKCWTSGYMRIGACAWNPWWTTQQSWC